MQAAPLELRPKTPESEKITINLGYVDLGHIDLLVRGRLLLQPHRFHSHGHSQPARSASGRRQAIGDQAQARLGLRRYSREDLEGAGLAAKRSISRFWASR